MEFGIFLEFPVREGGTEKEAFDDSFVLINEAEKLGVDSLWLAEYHFNPGRVMASPITIFGNVAARTERIRLGTGVICLPLANPLRVAEEIATLDLVSGGRVEFGIGRGTFPNVHEGFNSPFEESRARFDESLEIILKAWTSETFSFSGEFYNFDDVTVTPKPYQQPHPPIWVGVTSVDSFAVTGRMGYDISINPSRVFTLAGLKPQIEEYHKAWKDAGHHGKGRVTLRIPVYLSEDPQKAYDEPMESAMFSVGRLSDRTAKYAGYEGTTGNWGKEAEVVKNMSYDDWFRDKVAYGTPESVVDKLQGLSEELGLDQIMFEVNFGNLLPLENQLKSLRLMMEKVAPNLE
ncbi:MAG: LLM class flavin-dependent oxidoreductase [SAR202 cluster bacterium]|jgi:luciferase family oxidoreductase group 1|nr:LLM class flavin-dependent oxidoreductase [Dehalococcoidia bacterium]MQF89423.1 LLM class flavin-dependent oxidoreductase [SAR202 cluster bacterium]|tara:strand:- start:374 stop:1417 length:1044 start_codon:yes stop_codon:yes gene_type:complete